MSIGSWGADEWAAFGQMGGFVVALIAGPAVWVQVRQAKKIREEESRPYVIVDFETKGWIVHLVIKNIGTTPARDVLIAFDKELVVPGASTRPGDLDIFKAPIPMLAPGRTIRLRFGAGPDFFKPGTQAIPLTYTANLTYSDLAGRVAYRDPPLTLDLKVLQNTIVGADRMAEVASALTDINRLMKGWDRSGAIEVRSSDGDKRRRAQDRLDHRWGLRHAHRQGGVRAVVALEWARVKARLRD